MSSSKSEPEEQLKRDLRVLGIESTAHTFSAALVSEKKGLICDVRDIYVPPEGSGIHPTEASVHHIKVASKGRRGGRRHIGPQVGRHRRGRLRDGPGTRSVPQGGCRHGQDACALAPANRWCRSTTQSGTSSSDACLPVRSPPSFCSSPEVTPWSYRIPPGCGASWARPSTSPSGSCSTSSGRHVGYASPCGRRIEEAASRSHRYLRLPYTVKGNDVSFSGILTAAKRLVDAGEPFEDVCFSVQETAFATAVEVTERALAFTGNKELMVVGGVAANKRLAEMLSVMVERHSAKLLRGAPPLQRRLRRADRLDGPPRIPGRASRYRWRRASMRQSWRLDTVPLPWRDGGVKLVYRGAEADIFSGEWAGRGRLQVQEAPPVQAPRAGRGDQGPADRPRGGDHHDAKVGGRERTASLLRLAPGVAHRHAEDRRRAAQDPSFSRSGRDPPGVPEEFGSPWGCSTAPV